MSTFALNINERADVFAKSVNVEYSRPVAENAIIVGVTPLTAEEERGRPAVKAPVLPKYNSWLRWTA